MYLLRLSLQQTYRAKGPFLDLQHSFIPPPPLIFLQKRLKLIFLFFFKYRYMKILHVPVSDSVQIIKQIFTTLFQDFLFFISLPPNQFKIKKIKNFQQTFQSFKQNLEIALRWMEQSLVVWVIYIILHVPIEDVIYSRHIELKAVLLIYR